MAIQTKVDVGADISGFKNGMNEAKASVKDVASSAKDLNKELAPVTTSFRTQRKSAQELARAYRELTDAEKNSDYGKMIAKGYEDAIKKAAEMKDIQEDVNKAIKNMASDTSTWDATKQGIDVISSSVTAFAASLGIAAKEGTLMGDTLNLIARTQAMANAAITIGNALQEESALRIKATAAAQKALNFVMNANPYKLVAGIMGTVLIGSLVASIAKMKEAKTTADNLNSSFRNLGKSLSESLGSDLFGKASAEDIDALVIAQSKQKVALNKLEEANAKLYYIEQKKKDGYTNLQPEIEKYTKQHDEAAAAIKEHSNTIENIKNKYKEETREVKTTTKATQELTAAEIERNKQYEINKSIGSRFESNLTKGLEDAKNKLKNDKNQMFEFRLKPVYNYNSSKAWKEQGYALDEITQKYEKLTDQQKQYFNELRTQGKTAKEAFDEIGKESTSLKDTLSSTANTIGTVGSAFSALGQLTGNVGLNMMGVIAQCIANIMLAYSQSLAKDVPSKLNIFSFIAATAASTISMAATIAQYKKQAKSSNSFANGGIFKGATTIGDFNIARVNDGEMILNNQQQSNLFRMLNNGIERDSFTLSDNSNIEFKLRGTELIGLIKNTNKKLSKIL